MDDEDEKGFYVPGTKGHWAVYPKYHDGSKGHTRRECDRDVAELRAKIILHSDPEIKQVNIDWVIES